MSCESISQDRFPYILPRCLDQLYHYLLHHSLLFIIKGSVPFNHIRCAEQYLEVASREIINTSCTETFESTIDKTFPLLPRRIPEPCGDHTLKENRVLRPLLLIFESRAIKKP